MVWFNGRLDEDDAREASFIASNYQGFCVVGDCHEKTTAMVLMYGDTGDWWPMCKAHAQGTLPGPDWPYN